MAGRILVEIDAVDEARHHFETARSLDPMRAHILSCDLARLDALQDNWVQADATIAAIAGDADRAIAQLGSIFQARLALWRGDRNALITTASVFSSRMMRHANRLMAFANDIALTGRIDAAHWEELTLALEGTDRPIRNQLMGLQLLAEMALALGHPDLAIATLERADSFGLIDIFVLHHCPLFEPIADTPRFRRVVESVRNRAAGVLAAFRSTAG
jgi:hypothetical protein